MADKKLHAYERAEIADLYDGTPTSCRHLAKLFNVDPATVEWTVDYNGRRAAQDRYNLKYHRTHPPDPVKMREYHRQYLKNLSPEQREKLKLRDRAYYRKNRTKLLARMKAYDARRRKNTLDN